MALLERLKRQAIGLGGCVRRGLEQPLEGWSISGSLETTQKLLTDSDEGEEPRPLVPNHRALSSINS